MTCPTSTSTPPRHWWQQSTFPSYPETPGLWLRDLSAGIYSIVLKLGYHVSRRRCLRSYEFVTFVNALINSLLVILTLLGGDMVEFRCTCEGVWLDWLSG